MVSNAVRSDRQQHPSSQHHDTRVVATVTATTMMMMTMTATMMVNRFETPPLPAFQHGGCALSQRVPAGRQPQEAGGMRLGAQRLFFRAGGSGGEYIPDLLNSEQLSRPRFADRSCSGSKPSRPAPGLSPSRPAPCRRAACTTPGLSPSRPTPCCRPTPTAPALAASRTRGPARPPGRVAASSPGTPCVGGAGKAASFDTVGL